MPRSTQQRDYEFDHPSYIAHSDPEWEPDSAWETSSDSSREDEAYHTPLEDRSRSVASIHEVQNQSISSSDPVDIELESQVINRANRTPLFARVSPYSPPGCFGSTTSGIACMLDATEHIHGRDVCGLAERRQVHEGRAAGHRGGLGDVREEGQCESVGRAVSEEDCGVADKTEEEGNTTPATDHEEAGSSSLRSQSGKLVNSSMDRNGLGDAVSTTGTHGKRKLYSMANMSIGLGISGFEDNDSSALSDTSSDNGVWRDSSDPLPQSGKDWSVKEHLDADHPKIAKQVSFQNDQDHDADDESMRKHCPPASPQRHFPLTGGILKVKHTPKLLILNADGTHQDSYSSTSSSSSSSTSSRSSIDANYSMTSTLGEMMKQMVHDTAPHLSMTAEELSVEILSKSETPSIIPAQIRDIEAAARHPRISRFREEIYGSIGHLETANQHTLTPCDPPVLRSVRNCGPRLNLRDAFRKMETDGTRTSSNPRAMRRFEGATQALKISTNTLPDGDHLPRLESPILFKDEERRKDSAQDEFFERFLDVHTSSFQNASGYSHPEFIGQAVTSTSRTKIWAPALKTHDSVLDVATSTPIPTPHSLSTQPSLRNFSRPLSMVSTPRQSASAQVMQNFTKLSYADSSRLQTSRNNAWTIRQRALLEMNRPATAQSRYESKVGLATAAALATPTMLRQYCLSQASLIRRSTRDPYRVPRIPTPCSTCPPPSPPAEQRPKTPALKRRVRTWWRVIKKMPHSRTWFKHKSRHPLIKHPRAISRNYSRAEDWPSKNPEEMQRAGCRNGKGLADDMEDVSSDDDLGLYKAESMDRTRKATISSENEDSGEGGYTSRLGADSETRSFVGSFEERDGSVVDSMIGVDDVKGNQSVKIIVDLFGNVI